MDDLTGEASMKTSQTSLDGIFASSPSPSDTDASSHPLPVADAPILICTLPDTPQGGGDALGLGPDPIPMENTEEKSPSPTLGSPHRTNKRPRASRKRSRGLLISNPDSPLSDQDQDKDQKEAKTVDELESGIVNPEKKTTTLPPPREVGNGTSSGATARVNPLFPANLQDKDQKEAKTVDEPESGIGNPEKEATTLPPPREAGKGTSSGKTARVNPLFPANLQDVVNGFSRSIDPELRRRIGEMDILEIAAMKGIVFPRPRWWRPGGYEMSRPKSTD